MVVGDGVGDGLEEHGLTGLRLGDDQTALALSDRGEHVHDPAGQVFFMSVSKQVEFLVREEGSKEVERNTVADELRRTAVDIFDADQREILIPVARRTDLARHGVSGLEGVDLDLLLGDIDIVRRVQIIIVG